MNIRTKRLNNRSMNLQLRPSPTNQVQVMPIWGAKKCCKIRNGFHKGNIFGSEISTDAAHGTGSNGLTGSQLDRLYFQKPLVLIVFFIF